MRKVKLKAVDFFCGAGGMTSGFRKAGIKILAGIDIDQDCKETYEANNPTSKFIHADIKKLNYRDLELKAKITANDDNLVFIGCSPCQYWSIIKTNKSKSEESKNLLNDFKRFVDHFNPGYVVIENVPGIFRRIDESPLNAFLKFLNRKGYSYDYGVINTAHYGVPQTRKRFLLVASRVNPGIKIPEPDTKECLPTVRQFLQHKFPKIPAGYKDETNLKHTSAGLSSENLKRLELTPINGGTRHAWKDTELQIPAYVGKDNAFKDIYGRMFWDKPAPTITTKFHSITNGRFAHPEQNRGISLREGATLQTFDINYKFISDSTGTIAKLIGNAVPPELARRIALSIKHRSHA